jgi:hypothetical protein
LNFVIEKHTYHKEHTCMKRLASKFLLLIATSLIAATLNGCGGSGTTYVPVSSPSSTTDPSAKPSVWANVTVRAMDGMINLQWDNLNNSSSTARYNIYCSTEPTVSKQDSSKRIASSYNGRSFDHTALTNGQRYYYVVTEVSAAGEGTESTVVSATPQAAPPIAPYGPKVTALDASVKLEFNGPITPASTSVSYNIYRSTTRGGFTSSNIIATKIPAFSATTTPYIDLGLSNGTTYYYAVTAVTGVLESGFSPVVAAQPAANVAAVGYKIDPVTLLPVLPTYAAPATMTFVAQNGAVLVTGTLDTATLSVTPTTPVTPVPLVDIDPADYTKAPVFILYWYDSPNTSARPLGQITNLPFDATTKSVNFKLTGLRNGTTYYLRLAAAPVSRVEGAVGTILVDRQKSGPLTGITPALKAPVAPGYLTATQYGANQVQLACKKDTSGLGGLTYSIYMSTSDPVTPANLVATGTRIYNGANVYFTHSGLTPGTTYYYTATVVGEAESAPSSIVTVSL